MLNNNQTYSLNNFSAIQIKEYQNEILNIVETAGGIASTCQMQLNEKLQIELNPNIRKQMIDNEVFYEIISTNLFSMLQELETSTCKIYIFANHINICTNNNIYGYYFLPSTQNHVVEDKNKIYVFNQNVFLEFDLKNKAFCLKKCKKTSKNSQKYEFLCSTSHNDVFFVLYLYDTSTSTITSKKYKNNKTLSIDNYTLPHVFFNLCKNNFDEAKDLIDPKIDFNSIKEYLSKFDHMYEYDGQYFLSSNAEICKIKFSCNNKMIYEID
jgi:hypothetical protein